MIAITSRLAGRTRFTAGAAAPAREDCMDPRPDAPTLDEKAFEAFYSRTAAGLRRYLLRACDDPGRAEDVLQDSYVRFLNRPPKDRSDAAMRSYLYQVATNLLRDRWRRDGRERKALQGLLESQRMRPVPAAGAPAAGSPASLDLAAAFQQLSPRDRALLWLAHVEGYEHREIAAALGLKAASVRVLLFRLRRRLARQLAKGT